MRDDLAEVKDDTFLENHRVGLERDDRAVLFGLADLFDRRLSLAMRIFLNIDVAVLVDQNLGKDRQAR